MSQAALDQYLGMINDHVRSAAYEAAIAATVPGKVVVDLGAGCGFLSHLALKHGARKVYAIDADYQALGIATALARRFPGPERFVPLLGFSYDVQVPEPADVLVSETLDSNGIGENTHVAMADAARRFLAPGGRVIPERLDLFVALGESAEASAYAAAWSEAGTRYGLPYADIDGLLAGVSLTAHCPAMLTGDPATGVPGWQPWQSIDLARNDFRLHTVVPLRAASPGTVRGVMTAWRARLLAGIELSSLPADPPTHWKQCFMNLANPIAVERGDQFIFEIAFAESREPGVRFDMRLHHARAADRERFIAGLPAGLQPFVADGRVATIRNGQAY